MAVKRRSLPGRFWVPAVLIAVVAVAVLAIVLKTSGESVSAPSADLVPLATNVQIVQQAVPGTFPQSDAQAASYRYVEIAGPIGMSEQDLLSAELARLNDAGWKKQRSGSTARVVLSTPEAQLEMRSQRAGATLWLSAIRARWLRSASTTLPPLSNAAALKDVLSGRPALFLILHAST